jgi:zinc finger protein 830
MQELEARVQRLKEKREALLRHRRESLVEPVNTADIEIAEAQGATKPAAAGTEGDEAKENVKAAEDVDDTEAEDDDDDEDDWDGFRFRTGR